MRWVLAWLLLAALPEQVRARARKLYQIPDEHLERVEDDPWVPCGKMLPSADGSTSKGFCRLSCTAKWSYAPDRMDCEMIESLPLIERSFSLGLPIYQALSRDSFSKVQSAVKAPRPARLATPCPSAAGQLGNAR